VPSDARAAHRRASDVVGLGDEDVHAARNRWTSDRDNMEELSRMQVATLDIACAGPVTKTSIVLLRSSVYQDVRIAVQPAALLSE
jgi:hypothetical protein